MEIPTTTVNDSGQAVPTANTQLEPDEVQVLLTAASQAPSLHNSQPWSFEVGPSQVKIFADPSRQLRQSDPLGRSVLIGCGAALLNLRVAAEALGFMPRARVLPDPTDLTLVAEIEVDRLHLQSGGLGSYFPAVATRRTNRRPFRDEPIPAAVVADLEGAALAEGATLRVYDDPDEVRRIVRLLHDADMTERVDADRVHERDGWVSGERQVDGIPAESLGPRPTGGAAPFRDLGPRAGVPRDYAQFESTPTIAVLSTVNDDRADWVRAGQALQRVLLVATSASVSASFLNQPLEQDDLRWLVRSPTAGLGQSQMILRLGYGEDVPPTPRRPVEDMMR